MNKGGDLKSEGHDFESRALDTGRIFFTFFCKICIVCLKRQKINEKEAEDGGFFKKKKTKITNLMMQSENAFA